MSTAGVMLCGPTSAIVPALDGVSPDALQQSFAACSEITRRAARNFYYGLRLTPEPRRSAVYAIYAWMRRADDIVDEPAELGIRRQRLTDFAGRSAAALRGEIPPAEGGSPAPETFWPAFAATLASYPIDPACIHAMLAGLEEDLTHRGYATREDLDRYCYRVGSTVGLVCVSIWGLREGTDGGAARDLAITRGRAFQLTNILRDIGQDFDDLPRRVYVPEEDLARHGLTPADLRAWSDPRACTALVQELVGRARGWYEASAPLESMIDPACAPALWGMTRIYAGLLDLIAADPSRVVAARRVRLSSMRKGLIAVSAFVKSRRGAWGGAGGP